MGARHQAIQWAGAGLLFAVALPGFAADWQVAPGGRDLAQVIQQAAPGDRIRLHPGVYEARLVLDRPLTLVGERGAVIDGGGQGDVLRVRAADVTIRGVRLRGSGRSLTDMNAAIFVERSARNARIEKTVIEADGFGIWLDACRGARVLDNHIKGNPRVRSQDRGNGIHLFNVTRTLVRGNEIEAARDGIYIDTSNHNALEDNHIHHLRYGIHYMYSHHNRVVGNRTHDTRTGYALMQSKYLTVSGNRSENDQNYGVLMNYIVYSTIANNRVVGVRRGTSPGYTGQGIVGAEGKAVFIYNSQFNEIHGNRFAESDLGVHLTAGSEDNEIHGNAFVHNRIQVKYVATRAQEWSQGGRGNYWDDYLGWDMDADGIGDRPYEPNDAVDKVLWKYPSAKLLMHSPAVQILHWVQGQFPVFKSPGVRDSHPLMVPPRAVEMRP